MDGQRRLGARVVAWARGGAGPVPLIGAVALAAWLRLHDLTRTSLWLDEGYSVRIAVQQRHDFAALILSDVHPPLYYGLLAAWAALFGSGEFALRSLSVLFGTATIPIAFALGYRLSGWGTGLGAALLLATSSLHIQYNTEVRMYALQVMLLAAAAWGAVLSGLPRVRRAHRVLGLAAFVSASLLAVWTQVISVLALPCLSAFMLLAWWWSGRDRRDLRDLFLAHLALLAGLVASLPLLLVLVRNSRDLLLWVPPLSASSVAPVLGALFGQRLAGLLPAWLAAPMVLGLLGLALLALRGRDHPPRAGLFVAATVFLPLGVTALVSVVSKPVFALRPLLWILPMLAVALAIAVATLRERPWRRAAIGFLALTHLGGVLGYHAAWRRPEWRPALALLRDATGPDEPILAANPVGMTESLVRYYAPSLHDQFRAVHAPAELRAVVGASPHASIWLISAPDHDRVPAGEVGELLAPSHCLDVRHDFHRVRVLGWSPRAAGQCSRNSPSQ